MDLQSNHKISICVSCLHKERSCHPGFDLIKRLRDSLHLAKAAGLEAFEVSGIACMAGCSRSCTVAYHGSHKATYIFGDVDPDEDIEDLIAFAEQYKSPVAAWCASTDRDKELSDKSLVRAQAAILATEVSNQRLR